MPFKSFSPFSLLCYLWVKFVFILVFTACDTKGKNLLLYSLLFRFDPLLNETSIPISFTHFWTNIPSQSGSGTPPSTQELQHFLPTHPLISPSCICCRPDPALHVWRCTVKLNKVCYNSSLYVTAMCQGLWAQSSALKSGSHSAVRVASVALWP